MKKPLHVLLADDDASVRQITTLRLQRLGHFVEAVENGRLALELIREKGEAFDLVVLDVQMPEMDGLETIKRLRSDPAVCRLPILVMSASDVAAGMSAGADHFLIKPHSKEELESAINYTLRMRAAQRDGEQGDYAPHA